MQTGVGGTGVSTRLAVAFAALSILSSLPRCGPSPATASAEPGSGMAAPVALRGTFRGRILLTGELEAVHSDPISVPRTPAWQVPIRWIEADGTRVTRGATVVELDNSQFTGELEQKRLARSEAGNALGNKMAEVRVTLAEEEFAVERSRIDLAKARLDAEIPAELRQGREHQEAQLTLVRADYGYRKKVEELDSTRRASEAEIQELRLALDHATASIRVAEAAIDRLALIAPTDGLLVVSENRSEGRKFQTGDTVWVGLRVAHIPDLSEMKVVARLIDVDDGRIAPGMPVSCRIDAYPEEEFPGHVSAIAPIAQEDDDQALRRSFRVEIRLEHSDPETMRPGMSVRAQVLPPPVPDSVIVPRTALDLGGDAPRALLANGSAIDVTLGPCNALECVVTDGLEEGTRLRRLR